MTTTNNKKICLHCGKEYAVSSFYSHRNKLINDDFGFCKKCVKNNIDFNDMNTLILFLQTMDIPYLKEFWKLSNESDNETIGTYFKNMALKQNRELRFKNSDDIEGKTNKAELMNIDSGDFEVTDSVVKRWGRNLPLEDYMFLEDEFSSLGGYEAETTIEAMMYKNIAKTQLMMQKAYEEGDTAKYEKMSKILSTQMNDANIKPVQIKNASEDGSINNWGEWVRKIEETVPISEDEEEFEPKFVKNYVKRFFITQMKRVFGRATDDEIRELNKEDDK